MGRDAKIKRQRAAERKSNQALYRELSSTNRLREAIMDIVAPLPVQPVPFLPPVLFLENAK